MIQVQIDGKPMHADFGGLNTMGDLVELIKATIDPDTIITSIEFTGASLQDGDWSMPLSAHRGKTLEIRTGTKQAYLAERLNLAPVIIQRITDQFANAGESYRGGQTVNGNTQLSTAVEDLGAFVNWYASLLEMDSPSLGNSREEFISQVGGLQRVCEQILQQQLYNSWWVLSETINTRLNPKLADIRKLCDKIIENVGQAKAA